MGERLPQPLAQGVGELAQRLAAQAAADAQHDDEVARRGGRVAAAVEVGRHLHVFEAEGQRRQRRRDAGHRAGVVGADDGDLEGVRGQRAHLDVHHRGGRQVGQQAQVPDHLGRRVALEVRRGQAVEVARDEGGVEVGALAADGFLERNHSCCSFRAAPVAGAGSAGVRLRSRGRRRGEGLFCRFRAHNSKDSRSRPAISVPPWLGRTVWSGWRDP